MRITSRFERKYILPLTQYYCVRNALVPYMEQDPYTRRGRGRYLVRSLYFDTSDYQAYHERDDGFYGRIKLRIRTYTESADREPMVRVELKTKKGSVMEKYSSFVPYDRYRHFMQYHTWDSREDPVLEEFERLCRVRSLHPVLLVQYRREGYRSRSRSPVRITLDHNVHSSRARMLFPRGALLKPHHPRNILLEIKLGRGQDPPWLRRMVKEQSLKMVPNSKYVQGIEIIRPHMVTPGLPQ